MAWQAIAAVAAPVVGGLVGNMMGAKDRKAQQAAIQQALAELQQVGLPPDLSKRVIMEEFQQVGILTPELEQEIDIGTSQLAQITEDPSLRQTQLDALNLIMERGRVGLGPEERAAINQIRSEVQRDAEAKRAQILTDLAARGQAGSGAELIASLSAGQEASQRASSEGDRIAAMAAQNALAAMAQGGQLSGAMRSADLDLARTRGEAADRFTLEKFNAANQRQTRNVDRGNIAQQQNLSEKQRISEANIEQENLERQRMNQAQADYWDRKLNYGQSMANAYTGQAQASADEAARKAQMGAGIGGAVGGGITAYNQQKTAEELARLKKGL